MNVNLDLSSIWKDYIDIDKVEQKYNCKFVCETPIKDTNGMWRDSSSLIFYNEEAHPQGSNYMALSFEYIYNDETEKSLVISDGISATKEQIVGLVDGDEVIYSRFRHDYRSGKNNSFIDGGRDYTRGSVGDYVSLKIVEGKLLVEKEVNVK